MKHLPLLFLLFCLAVTTRAQMRGYPYAPRLYSWRIGLEAGAGVLGSDLTKESHDYHFRPIANLELSWILHRNFAFGFFGGGGTLRSTQENLESNTSFLQGGMLLELRAPLLRGSVFPFVQLRGGGFIMHPALRIGRFEYTFDASSHVFYGAAAGIEAISWRHLGIRGVVGVTYTNTDQWDMVVRGDDNDGYSWVALALEYYFVIRR